MLAFDDNHIENTFTMPYLKRVLLKAHYDINFDTPPQELGVHLNSVERLSAVIENYCGLRLERYKELSEQQ